MKQFQGVTVQRCQVHFMRNFLGKLSKRDQQEGKHLLQNVFGAHSYESAHKRVEDLTHHLRVNKKDKIADWIEENVEEALSVLTLPTAHRKKMRSTNMLERLNEELKEDLELFVSSQTMKVV